MVSIDKSVMQLRLFISLNAEGMPKPMLMGIVVSVRAAMFLVIFTSHSRCISYLKKFYKVHTICLLPDCDLYFLSVVYQRFA